MNETHDTLWELYGSACGISTYEELRERPVVWKWTIHGRRARSRGRPRGVCCRTEIMAYDSRQSERKCAMWSALLVAILPTTEPRPRPRSAYPREAFSSTVIFPVLRGFSPVLALLG